ncbi:MAG TPA: methylated-DNA--[protein]-cysteine S-methyltransferase [Candidatus Kapabacteria bacterium]|nr:methylated-DNA--[protein]-cysteine S-methyltransferase [Candidatus Kapabacteria bacterium]
MVQINSPVGYLDITASDAGIQSIFFSEQKTDTKTPSPLLSEAIVQLEEYFAGNRTTFDLPLNPQGTDFQKRVWKELLNIPFGETISYIEVSRRLGDEKAIRAVGLANGKNPISIIIPCHRVIGSNGKLVGYGGGLWRKEWLLKHEGCMTQESLF